MTATRESPDADAAARELEQRHAFQAAYAQEKAEWQADLRLRFQAFMGDFGWRHHRPETIEIAQFLLQLVAEDSEDYDLLALILTFAERLPYELKQRREEHVIATEFLRVAQERRRFGVTGKPAKEGTD